MKLRLVEPASRALAGAWLSLAIKTAKKNEWFSRKLIVKYGHRSIADVDYYKKLNLWLKFFCLS